MKWRNITDNMRGKVDKLVKAGAFGNKSGGSDKTTIVRSNGTRHKKQGVANTVVKEEDDGEEMEVEEDGFPPQEHLLQMLGMSNTSVGNVNDIKEPDWQRRKASIVC